MTYIYAKKDLTFIEDPAAQTLVKTFLTALYTDEYITQCEEEFGFVRVAGDLRDKALSEIDALVTSPGAPEWTFEFDTEARTGQGDYVISVKRESYSEVEQDSLVDMMAEMQSEIERLKAANEIFVAEFGHTHDDNSFQQQNQAMSEDSQVKAALVLSSISFALWMLAIIALLVRCATGSHSPAEINEISKPASSPSPEIP